MTPFFKDLFFTDYDLILDQGIFVCSENKKMWTIKGKKIKLPRTIHLDIGWNLVTIPTTVSAQMADEIIAQINDQGGAAEVIMWWNGDEWIAYTLPLFFTNYELVKGQGYFIRCGHPYDWEIR